MSDNETPRLAVLIVTHDGAEDLPGCFEALEALTSRPFEVILVDCASQDDSARIAAGWQPGTGITVRTIACEQNLGFAGGMNRALTEARAPWILALNADARPTPDYVERLWQLEEVWGRTAGALTGRLLRPVGSDGVQRIDACGMRLLPTWRHLDRGSGEEDRGQWHQAERVFGATGAASLFRRAALDDVAIDGEVFDQAFHSFREDAELAFRLRERAWEVLYEPTALCEHRRFNLPERRSAMPAEVNFHSLKNRYLLRCYHQTRGNFLLTLPWTLWRDTLALGYVLLRERSSLEAYRWLWRHRRLIRERRKTIQARRNPRAASLQPWFWRAGAPLEIEP